VPQRNADKANSVIPLERIAQVRDREGGKHRKRDDLLNGLELRVRELIRAKPVGRDLKAEIEKHDAQLAMIPFDSGALRYYRRPYHRTVRKMFEIVRRMM